MSQILPKNKQKRTRTSSNETNTSFVKNVTSRVSCLLPSTIKKWFSSPTSSNANGSTPTADASDSSEDEATETPGITQPPAKRMRFSPPGTYNHYSPTDATCSTNDVEVIEIPYSPYTSKLYAQQSRNTYTTPLRAQNEDQEKLEQETTPRVFKFPHTVSSIGQSVANKRKSIFDTTTKEEVEAVLKTAANTVRDPKQPSFKPSLLGLPFYPARTMYGGASSSYINQPNIKQQSVAVVNESKNNDDSTISSSARQVMDLLESYSSPLMEARRIPLYTKPKNHSFNVTADRCSPYANKSLSYKTQELYVPSIASILRLKKKSRLMDTTNVARQIIASHSSASSNPIYPTETKWQEPEKEQPNKMTTKVKSRLTRTNRGNQGEDDVATPVKLPSAVLQLDHDKLPQFSFGTPAVSKPPTTSTPKIGLTTPVKNHTQVSASKPETVTSNEFKFSSPVQVSGVTPQACMTPIKFTFESPDRRIDQKFESKRSVVIGVVEEPEKTTNRSKDWQCPDCWVKNKPEANKCVCCGSKPPTQNAKCSICKLADSQSQKDKCANCEKMSVPNPIAAKSTGISQASKWKCGDCWVSNEDTANKCACCGGSRPKKSSSALAPAAVASVTSTVTMNTAPVAPISSPLNVAPDTSKVDANWKCEDCWISNKSSVDKCAACGGARPGVKQSSVANVTSDTSSFFGANDTELKNIIQSQKSDKWECSTCLVRNESNIHKCVCCGAIKESKMKIPASNFNFGTTANSSFKFGIDPKVQEATIAQKPEVNSTIESKTKPQSETNNNVLAETPTFTFTLPTKKVDIKADASKEKSDEAPKMNFTFGIPKPIPKSTGETNKLPSSKDTEEEKLQEVPSVDLNTPVPNKPQVPTLTATNNESKTIPSTNLLNPLPTDAKKDLKVNSVPTPVVSSTEKPKPTFSFGMSSNTKLFETPASTATTMNLFTQKTQTTTQATTSAPALSLFKPPTTSTPTTSLFQAPDMSAKPAPLFQNSEKTNSASTGAMFTFGSNGPSNSAPPAGLPLSATPEKPKFQFTFGSNPTPKADSPAIFKSPFATPESNVNANNTFNLSAGTTLGTTNNIPSNTLGGSNGLAGSNGLTGNALAGNTLGGISGNSLPGNTLSIGGTGTLGGTNGLSGNPLSGESSMQPSSSLAGGATGLFNNTAQDIGWSPSNNASSPNLFASNTSTSSLQRPATFTFGSSTPFNAAGSTPTFGAAAAPTQNIFAMNNQNNNSQSSLFSNTVQSQPSSNLFGSPPPATSPAPQMPMFGSSSIGATPTFGAPNPSIPSFESTSHTPAPAPAFNFGAPHSTGIFGFGQQPQLQQQQMQQQQQHLQPQPLQHPQNPQQPGVYSFGGAPAGAPQVQFSMGSGANPAVRRVRKAVRRNPQR